MSFSPVRIFVLWHPAYDCPGDLRGKEQATLSEAEKLRFDRGLRLARRIYHWFRLDNMEGIPVYFRSAPREGESVTPPKIPAHKGVRNYVIPLVESNMVSSPEWREYVSFYAQLSRTNRRSTGKPNSPPEFRLLPVALETVAYNMPECMRNLNFIRHIPSEEVPQDDAILLARLTEVLCRDLRACLMERSRKGGARDAVPDKIKIFLSHAKADDTEEAIALKEYIQSETQCEAFFDETDIASGYNFKEVLGAELGEDSAGLIVIQGDNYADRPWCRKEIRDFLEPVNDPLADEGSWHQFRIHPALVVQTMKGRQIARTIPELGYSPCVRWQDDAARFVVTTLLREILFSLFYRSLARRVASERKAGPGEIYTNRGPDPVMIARILTDRAIKKNPPPTVVYPGYGLSTMEQTGLEEAFPNLRFHSFLNRSTTHSPLAQRLVEGPSSCPLKGKLIAVSVGNSDNVLNRGLGDEHIQELLVRLMRPVFRAQASVLYGGGLPGNLRPEQPWADRINFTAALLKLLLTERAEKGDGSSEWSRLFVPKACHERDTVSASLVALWADVCSFVLVPPEDSGVSKDELAESPPAKPTETQLTLLSAAEKRQGLEQWEDSEKIHKRVMAALKSRGFSAMRRKICDEKSPLVCELLDSPPKGERKKKIRTFAHIFLGGKSTGFSGIMPGIFEEVLYAFKAKKPVFIISEGGGAAGVLAQWLTTFPKPKSPPPEFTPDFYGGPDTAFNELRKDLKKLQEEGIEVITPDQAFAELWKLISSATDSSALAMLLNNQLSGAENVKLLEGDSSLAICDQVWTGLAKLLETPGRRTRQRKK